MTETTHQQRLEAIRQKCVEANPEIGEEKCQCCGFKKCDYSTTGCSWYVGRPIHLADVLLTLQNNGIMILVNEYGEFLMFAPQGHVMNMRKSWLLREDSLDAQSEECITFLYDLLHPSK